MSVRPAPAVSIIVITHNHACFVDQCLESVERQTSGDFETVVIDNCSTDGTMDHVGQWIRHTARDVRVIVNPRSLTVCENRNQFLRVCRGEFIASLSGDDYYEPDRIARQLRCFREQPASVAAVFGLGHDARLAEDGVWFDTWSRVPDGRIFEELVRDNFLSATTVMLRRSAVNAVGGYDEGLFYEDYDMFLRLADRFEFRYLPGIVSNYRLSAGGASRAPQYVAAMSESTTRLLLKWHGRGLPQDAVIERRARFHAWRAFGADAALGRVALQAVRDASPSLVNRASVAFAEAPAAHWLTSRIQGVVRGVKSRRRERMTDRGLRTFP